MALLFVLVLLFLGQRGRREATLNARVDEHGRVRQNKMGISDTRPSALESNASGTASTTDVSTNGPSAAAYFARAGEQLIAEDFDAALQNYQWIINVISNQMGQGIGGSAAVGLAEAFEGRGNVFLTQGKPDAAVAQYENCVGILTQLVQAGERSTASALWRAHFNCGNGYFVLRRNDLATNHYERATAILSEMPRSAGVGSDIAMAQNNIGNVLLMRGKAEGAISKYEAAIKVLEESKNEGDDQAAIELATFQNNRGVARRLIGGADEAIADLDSAVELLSQVKDMEEGKQTTSGDIGTRVPRVYLDVMMGYGEGGFEISMRTRIGEKGRGKHAAIALALAYRNRGFTQLAEGRVGATIEDFRAGVEILRKLVEEEKQSDIASQFAKGLTSLAWVMAVSYDDSARNGAKAKGFATRACELTDWRAQASLEALAAALAETGEFAGAVQWQEKAVELASPAQKGEAVKRLDLYKTGKPFRTGFERDLGSRN